MNEKITEYIDKQKSPQKEICQKLRQIIFDTFPHIEEEMKWGVPSYRGGRYYIVALKDQVNIGFSMQGLTKDDERLFDGGGKTMKHIKISLPEEIDNKRIVKLLKFVEERQK